MLASKLQRAARTYHRKVDDRDLSVLLEQTQWDEVIPVTDSVDDAVVYCAYHVNLDVVIRLFVEPCPLAYADGLLTGTSNDCGVQRRVTPLWIAHTLPLYLRRRHGRRCQSGCGSGSIAGALAAAAPSLWHAS